MMDIHEIYTIETWMIGDPLPKKRSNKKKTINALRVASDSVLQTENKENVVVAKQQPLIDTSPMTIKQQTIKKDSTTDFLKQLAEKMKTASYKPLDAEEKVKSEPIKNENEIPCDKEFSKPSVIPSSSSEPPIVTSADLAKQAASLISDDLWSVLQNINVKNIANVTQHQATSTFSASVVSPNISQSDVHTSASVSAILENKPPLPGYTQTQNKSSQQPFSYNALNIATCDSSTRTYSHSDSFTDTQYNLTTSHTTSRPSASTAFTPVQSQAQISLTPTETTFTPVPATSKQSSASTNTNSGPVSEPNSGHNSGSNGGPNSGPNNGHQMYSSKPNQTVSTTSLSVDVNTKASLQRPQDPRSRNPHQSPSPISSHIAPQCETNFDKAPLPNSFIPSAGKRGAHYMTGGRISPSVAGRISPVVSTAIGSISPVAAGYSPDITQSPHDVFLNYSPRDTASCVHFPTDPRKARVKPAVHDPRLQRRRTDSPSSHTEITPNIAGNPPNTEIIQSAAEKPHHTEIKITPNTTEKPRNTELTPNTTEKPRNTEKTAEKPKTPAPLSSTFNLTAAEEAVIMCNYGGKTPKTTELQPPELPTLRPPSVTPSFGQRSPIPCQSPADKSEFKSPEKSSSSSRLGGKSSADKRRKSKEKNRKKLPAPVEEETIEWNTEISKMADLQNNFVLDSDQGDDGSMEEWLVESTLVTYRKFSNVST